jgi:hypothetical protein
VPEGKVRVGRIQIERLFDQQKTTKFDQFQKEQRLVAIKLHQRQINNKKVPKNRHFC